MQSNFSTLCRGHIIPKELDRETTTKFMEADVYKRQLLVWQTFAMNARYGEHGLMKLGAARSLSLIHIYSVPSMSVNTFAAFSRDRRCLQDRQEPGRDTGGT